MTTNYIGAREERSVYLRWEANGDTFHQQFWNMEAALRKAGTLIDDNDTFTVTITRKNWNSTL